jgi:RND family efflux transporter MFP subunit
VVLVKDLVVVRMVGETMKLIAVLVIAALLAMTSSCSSSTPAVAASAATPADQPRPAATPSPAEPAAFVAIGPIVVEQQVELAALRDGVVTEVGVDVDMPVQRGQLLARLDDRQLLAERDAATHKLRSIEADVKNWEMQLKVREVDSERSEALLKYGINTQQQVDHDRYTLTASQYELDRERENALNARSGLESIELELEKTRITAPFTGMIARRYIRRGQRVASGDKLFWVTAVEPLEVRFTLPEEYSRSLQPGDQVEVTVAAALGHAVPARVTRISPVVDPASGTVEVTAVIKQHSGLRPGLTANIRVVQKP